MLARRNAFALAELLVVIAISEAPANERAGNR